MKTQIRNIKSNPFRIGGFRKEALEMLESSMATKKIGHFGSFPVRKTKNGKFELACRHHTLEALRRKNGSGFQVPVTVHEYDDEQMFLVLYRENLTQRGIDKREYFNAVSETAKWLRKHHKIRNMKPDHIASFLNHGDPNKPAKGKIVSERNITRYFNIYKGLHPALVKEVIDNGHIPKAENNEVTTDAGEFIACIPNKSEQLQVASALRKDPYLGNGKEQALAVNAYRRLTKKEQKQILSGQLSLSDAQLITKINVMEKDAKGRLSSTSSGKKFSKMKMKAEDFLLVGLVERLNQCLKVKPIHRRTKAHELQVMLQALSKTINENLKSFKSKARIVQMPVSPKKREKRSASN